MVENEELYGRFIMHPRHYKNNVIGEKFITLRPIDQGGISGFILSRLLEDETIEIHKKSLEEKTKQTITSMGTAKVKDLRACSIEGAISVDIILTQESYPYHAEIKLFLGKEHTLIIENSRSPEFLYVCDQIRSLLLKGFITV